MTIVSTYYATKKRRYGFHENWYTATVYIQNLALIDFLYCLVLMIKWVYEINMHIRHYANDENGNHNLYEKDTLFCNVFVHLQIFLGLCDKWAIVVIGITRAIAITNNLKWENICDRKRNVAAFILFPWIVSIVICYIYDGIYDGPDGTEDIFSRNMNTGVCAAVEIRAEDMFKYILNFSLETTLIIFSYLYIFFYVTKQSRLSKSNTSGNFFDQNIQRFRLRNIRAAKTMAMIAFSSIFLSLPMFVTILLYHMKTISNDSYSLWGLISLNIFILQYSNNLFIYVWRKDENMCAIMDIVPLVNPKCITKTQKHKMTERANEINECCNKKLIK